MIKFNTFISSIFLIKYLLQHDNVSFLSLFFKKDLFDKKLATIFLETYYDYLFGLTLKCFNTLTAQVLNEQVEYWEKSNGCRFFIQELPDLLILLEYLFTLNISIRRLSDYGTDSELFIYCVESRGSFNVLTNGYKCLFFADNNVLVSCFRKVFSLFYSNLSYSWEFLPISFVNEPTTS